MSLRSRIFLIFLITTLIIVLSSSLELPVKARGRTQEDIPTPSPTVPSTMPSHLSKITTSNANQITLLGVPHGPTDWVTGISFSPNNILAVSDFEGQIYLWDTKTLNLRATLKPSIMEDLPSGSGHVVFSPSGKLLAASVGPDYSVLIWDADEVLKNAAPKPQKILRGFNSRPQSIAFSPDGKMLAAIAYDGEVRLWDGVTGILLTAFQTDCSAPGNIAFSPDGTTLALALCDGIRLWNVKTQKSQHIVAGDPSPTNTTPIAVAFSPDGTLLAFERDRRLQLVDLKTGKDVASLSSDNFGVISGIVFSPDGTIIAAGSVWYYIVLWEVKSGKKLAVLDTGGVSNLVFNADGTLLAAGHAGCGIPYWVTVWGVR